MTVKGNETTFVCVAVAKSDNGKQITGLHLITLPSMENYGVVELSRIVSSKLKVHNMRVVKDKNGKYTVESWQGNLMRYPVVSATGRPIFSHAVTILAKTTIKKQVFKVNWVNGEPVEEKKVVMQDHYFVSTYEGVIGLITTGQLIQIGVNYTITNGAIRRDSIYPLGHGHSKATPFIELQANVAPEGITADNFDKHVKDIDTCKADNLDAYMKWMKDSNLVMLSMAESRKCRALGSIVSDSHADATQLNLTEDEVSAINRHLDKVITWGMLPPADLEFMLKMFDKVKLSDDKVASMYLSTTDKLVSSTCFQEMMGTISDPISRAYNIRSYARLSDFPKNIYCEVLKSEPAITDTMKKLVSSFGGSLSGLEFRLKSPSSFTEKIFERSRLWGETPREVCLSINDVLRYTVLFRSDDEVDEYVAKAGVTLEALRFKANHQLISFKNFWKIVNNPYNGVNTTFYITGHLKYELQVHTPESLSLKNGEMHKLYEEERAVSTTPERKLELNKEMHKLSRGLRKPSGVMEFEMSLDNSERSVKA